MHLVRSAYEPAGSLAAWLDALTAKAAALLEGHHGAVGRVLDARTGHTVGDYAIHISGAAVRRAFEAHQAQSAHRIDFLAGDPQVRSVRRATARASADAYLLAMRRRFEAVNVHDMLHLTAYDGERYWVTLGFVTARDAATLWSPRSWAMASVHFATGLRLQRRAFDLGENLPDHAAILTDGGAFVHASGLAKEPSARERLRRAARELDAGRERGVDPERALTLWKGLVDGTWSVVDRHDHDGRRYIVAVPNPVSARDVRALSAREAQVAAFATEGYSEKWIAYTLGLGRTTVANHLRSALAKLGLPSPISLVGAFRDARGDRET